MDKDTYIKLFRQNLSQTLNQMNISDRHLSMSLEASEGYINNIVNGKSNISLDKLFEIAVLLDIPPHTFFDFDTPLNHRLSRMQSAFLQLKTDEQEHWIRLMEAQVMYNKSMESTAKEDR